MSQIAAYRSLAGIWHHGILCENGTVIHFTGDAGPALLSCRVASSSSTDTSAPSIRRTSYRLFQADSPTVYDVVYGEAMIKYSMQEIEKRAERCIGGEGYNLFINNCENFASWCVTGRKDFSSQSYLAAGCAIEVARNIDSLGIVGGAIAAAVTFGIANSSPHISQFFLSDRFGFKLVERTEPPKSSDCTGWEWEWDDVRWS